VITYFSDHFNLSDYRA